MAFIVPDGTGFSLGTLTDNDYLTVSGSSIVGTVPILVLGDQVQNTSSALADVTGFAFAVEANTDYWFNFYVVYQNTDALGVQLAVNGPASPTSIVTFCIYPQSLSGWSLGSANAYNSPVTNTVSPVNLDTFGQLEGVFRNGANAGNLILRFAPITNGQTMTVKANSTVLWQKI